jgi:HEAT repeat protein
MPRAMQFELVLQQSSGGGARKLPVKVTYKLVEGNAVARAPAPPAASPTPSPRRGEERADTGASSRVAGSDAAKPAVDSSGILSADDFNRVLADLKSSDLNARRRAAERLGQTPANERRDEVARALAQMLTDSDRWARRSAAQALGNWGTKESTPALVALLSSDDVQSRWAAIKSLGQLQATDAAAPLAERLTVLADRSKAAEALESLGTAAEPAVIKLLGHTDVFTRLEAVQVLKVIGTKESLQPLEALKGDLHVAHWVKEAIDAIKSRR